MRGNLLGIDDFAFCDEETNTPQISITFGSRPDLDGDPGLLTFSDGTEYSGNPLTFQSGQTIVFPYPASLTTPLTLTYSIFGETATAVVTLPEDCPPSTTTTTSSTSPSTDNDFYRALDYLDDDDHLKYLDQLHYYDD